MIRIYNGKNSDRRFKQVVSWMDNHNVNYDVLFKKHLSTTHLKKILSLSTNGFTEIIISKHRLNNNQIKIFDTIDIHSMSTNEMLDFLIKHPSFVKYPITFDETKLLIGYNSDDIRQFLPRQYRLSSKSLHDE